MEYALILTVIGVVLTAAVSAVGQQAKSLFGRASTSIAEVNADVANTGSTLPGVQEQSKNTRNRGRDKAKGKGRSPGNGNAETLPPAR